jgi:histone-arginine methyltransferase CARM1
MLADYVRTGTYQHAFMENSIDFKDKTILDVGTGTGILAFFAIQAGAKMVYAVEASESAKIASILATNNGYQDKITVIKGKLEEINLPEKVDIIISEPIGFLLVHERMLETYLIARDRFLKPGGLMFPSTGSIVIAPLSDEVVYKEQISKAEFWLNNNFYGLDLSSVMEYAYSEYLSQVIVGFYFYY